MNKFTIFFLCIVIFVIGMISGRFLLPEQGSEEQSTQVSVVADTPAETVEEPAIWTCSMHPQIQQPEPGSCPICGMDLIPLEQDNSADDGPRMLSMSENSRALADIQTVEITEAFPEKKIRLVGSLAYDETRVKSLTARFGARIDTLYVNFTGVQVAKGDKMAEVYSPQLLAAQRELLSAYKRDPSSTITRAVKDKLRLWGLLPSQVESIIQRGKARDNFILRAPIGGVVITKNVKEGDYIELGNPFFRIVDLSELWLNLFAYESDLTSLRYGQDVTFSVEAYPGEEFHGRVAFIDPQVDMKTRTVAVRVNVPNKELKLKPGMFARGSVSVKLARDGKVFVPELAGKWIGPTHPEVIKDEPGKCDICGEELISTAALGYAQEEELAKPLIIPESAVLRTGKRAVVYVELQERDEPTFEGREIVLGPKAGHHFIVKSGLAAGELVVSKGAFKIDSALQIQARPSMMNPEGVGSAPDQGSSEATTSSTATQFSDEIRPPAISVGLAMQMLPPYLALQDSLASDNLEGAKVSLNRLIEITGHSGELARLIHTMYRSTTLEDIRRPHFETLSNLLIDTLSANPEALSEELLIMHCPMAFGDRGADWLQRSEPLRNPYFGAVMLSCGEITGRLNEGEGGTPDNDQ